MRVEIDECMEDEEARKELIEKLLGERSGRARRRKKESKKSDYEGKNDPENPENELDFRKAYKKLAGKLSDRKDTLIRPEELSSSDDEETVSLVHP